MNKISEIINNIWYKYDRTFYIGLGTAVVCMVFFSIGLLLSHESPCFKQCMEATAIQRNEKVFELPWWVKNDCQRDCKHNSMKVGMRVVYSCYNNCVKTESVALRVAPEEVPNWLKKSCYSSCEKKDK